MIERVQSRATKLVPLISNFDYEKNLEALNLTTLADQRLRGDAIQMYKCMHKIDEIDKANRFQVASNSGPWYLF